MAASKHSITFNRAILSGQPHHTITNLVESWITPNADTLDCTLFSNLPHYTIRFLWEKSKAPKDEYLTHSYVHHPLRTEILGTRKYVANIGNSAHVDLSYARSNLQHLAKQYGEFKRLADSCGVSPKGYNILSWETT